MQRETQGTIRHEAPDRGAWVLYFLRALKTQNERLQKKIERERIMVEALPALSLEVLELAKEHGRLTVGQVVKLTGANRNTVKKHLQALVASNHLMQNGKGKGTQYARAT